ncbi:MAG: PHP domain-containing protein [Spirochaetales bacterium]
MQPTLCLSSVNKGSREIPPFVAAGKAHGLRALALLGKGTLFGVRRFVVTCQQHGILPLIGCEFPITGPDDPTTSLVLVHSEAGFRRLQQLSTHFARHPRSERHLTKDELGLADDDLVILRNTTSEGLSPQTVEELARRYLWEVLQPKIQLPEFLPPPGFVGTTEQYLRQLVQLGLAERFQVVTPEIQQRAEIELAGLCVRGWASYLLIWADMLAWARSQGIAVGPGRGTTPGSMVAYALKITAVDPLAHGLLFERFFNPGVSVVPDIDVDVSAARRTEVVAYLKERWGRDRVADVACHGCGVIVSAWPLSDQFASFWDPTHEGLVPQCAFQDLELHGLIKFDLLGLDALDDVPQAGVPLDDQATWNAFANGETEGVFGFESPKIRAWLRQVQPRTLDELSVVYALCRPGGDEAFSAYCDAPKSLASPDETPDPLAPILDSTRGVLVYQEQVLQIVAHLTALGVAEAETLRRVLFRQVPATLEPAKANFVEAAVTNGFAVDIALPVWERLVQAGGRPFMKSHSLAYSLLAYQVAFMRQSA